MKVTPSLSDVEFKDKFEAGSISPSEFNHRQHVRLAFVYLCEFPAELANQKMRSSLKKFLDDNGVPAEKYNETITYSWILAVRHFMESARNTTSFDGFINADDRLLDTAIMFSHYKRETLFSEKARHSFVLPDIENIPQYQ